MLMMLYIGWKHKYHKSTESLLEASREIGKHKKYDIGLGAFAASELDKVFSGYQPR
jgi:hypothetical protein